MKNRNFIFLIFALVISSIGIVSLLKPGFFLTDDGNSMVIRFSAFYEALRSGQFPVRFLPRLNFGFGYPVADFLYPLFMYLGVPIHAVGFSFVNTIKIILGLSFLSGTLFSFLWLKKFFDNSSSFFGSVFYSLFPYHLYDIYKRGSVGEALSLGIFPFILWQIERRNIFWTSIGISLLILAHNTLAALFLGFIVLYGLLDMFVNAKRRKLFQFYFFSISLGLGLSSFFAIPAVLDLQYTVFNKTSVSDWSKYFADFNQIGISSIAVFLVILFFVLAKRIEIKKHRLAIFMFIVGFLSIFLSSPSSTIFWQLIPASYIQFPFRFLSLAIISTGFLSACIISVLKGKEKGIGIILGMILIFFSSKDFLYPKAFQNYPDTFYSTNQDTTTVKGEYMPSWVSLTPDKMPQQKVKLIGGKADIKNLTSKGTKLNFLLDAKEKSLIQINTVYFPGWEIRVDGIKKEVSYNNKYGIIQFEANRGNHVVEAKFVETRARLISDFISIISILVLIYISKKYA